MSKNVFKIIQLSYVYKDIEKQAKIFELLFGMPKFLFYKYANASIIYRDVETKMSAKCGRSKLLNSYSIELIQPTEGEDNLYNEFLNKGREGLQHVDVLVYDIEYYINYFEQKGIKVIQEGKSIKKWAYMDTEESLGFILELVDAAPSKRRGKSTS